MFSSGDRTVTPSVFQQQPAASALRIIAAFLFPCSHCKSREQQMSLILIRGTQEMNCCRQFSGLNYVSALLQAYRKVHKCCYNVINIGILEKQRHVLMLGSKETIRDMMRYMIIPKCALRNCKSLWMNPCITETKGAGYPTIGHSFLYRNYD